MRAKSNQALLQAGFSLVEVMVGLAIALIATLVISQTFIMFEGRKRTTTTGADAQTDVALAAYSIERDVKMAGYGLNRAELQSCTVNSNYDGTDQPPLSLVPLVITDGIGGAPDTIRTLASSKAGWSVPARLVKDHPPQATNMFLNTAEGIVAGDLMVAYQPGKECTLLQVTGAPEGVVQIHHQNTSPWNPPGGQNIFPKPDGYTTYALLFNLGSLNERTYSVDAGGNLAVSVFQMASNTYAVMQSFANVVNLQAEYGFDDRVGTQVDARVTNWSSTMVDADKDGTTGDSGDIERIYAMRMAIVTRSIDKAAPASGGRCNITTSSNPDNRPSWSGGVIDVSKNPDGTDNAQWQCYRYHVLETVVPLRNQLWREATE